MKTLLTLFAFCLCLGAFGQNLKISDKFDTSGATWGIIVNGKNIPLKGSAFSDEFKEPMYDTIQGVLVYFISDSCGVQMKADSAYRIMKADRLCPAPCPEGRHGCLVYHVQPCWYEYRLQLYSGEVVDSSFKISFH